MSDSVAQVPTNIITGSLGVGKTTLIQSLLKQKPADERWAVLVNEFGEVGIDGAMLSGISSRRAENEGEPGVYVKEVPGGCMCCTSGLPMQIALNLLLAQSKPHRLLIEPTGLGHPKEVLQTLTQSHYQDVLDVQGTLTLVDARKLNDERWRQHPTFREQAQIADLIVVTKLDLYTQPYQAELEQYLSEVGVPRTPVIESNQGEIELDWLQKTQVKNTRHSSETKQAEHNHPHSHHSHSHSHSHQSGNANPVLKAPDSGVISIKNQGQGYFSRGWICAKDKPFDYEQCHSVISSLRAERFKAVLMTNKGIFSFNLTGDNLEIHELDEAKDSRLEFIVVDEQLADDIARQLAQQLDL